MRQGCFRPEADPSGEWAIWGHCKRRGACPDQEDPGARPSPDCGGKLRVIASVEEPALIAKILAHLSIRDELEGPAARAPPAVGSQELKIS